MRNVLRKAQAGLADKKNDVLICIEPAVSGGGIKIEIKSPVLLEFGRQIRETVRAVLAENDIEDALVQVQDKGAMTFAIRARTETAVRRAIREE